MLGGVGGRHVSTRRRGSSPLVRGGAGLGSYGGAVGPGAPGNSNDALGLPPDLPKYAIGRRRAVTTSDHKSCALIHTRLKVGDIKVGDIM
ncbi:hypothetical protein KM043_015979 [Ampulex compressa]|nr:hypothetical protein KM043_015979 [Ampulex compressa]